MAAILEVILALFAEFLIPVVAEILFELFSYGLIDELANRKRRPFYIEGFGYVIVGLMLGIGSLFIFPGSFIASPTLQTVNLFATPALAGCVMMGIGAIRRRRGQNPIRLDSFFYGAVLAFSVEIVRYFGTV